MSDSEQLIDQLGRDLKPVKPARLGIGILSIWALVCIGVVGMMIAVFGLRSDLDNDWMFWTAVVGIAGSAIATLALCHGAMRLLIPGTKLSSTDVGLAAFGGIVMVVAATLVSAGDADVGKGLAIGGLGCVGKLMVVSALPGIILIVFARRYAPTRLALVGGLLAGATLAFAYGTLLLVCRGDDSLHLLLYHLLPAVTASALGGGVIARILRW